MKYRFASKEWLAAAHGILAQRTSSLAVQGFKDRVSICEIYDDCPADLGWDNGVLAWSCVYQDGAVDFRLGVRDDVSFRIRGSYAACAPLAAFEVGSDAARAETFGQMIAERLAAGDVAVEIGQGFVEPGDLESFHDVLARITSVD